MGSINKQHMTIHWKHIVKDDDSVPSTEATLKEKATLVGRIGQMMLSVGTGAWRVRNSMNEVARTLGISCTADIGLLSIEFTCYEESGTYTHSIALPTTGVNTDKLNALEAFMREFPEMATQISVKQIHLVLDEIQKKPANYKAWNLGLAAAIACCAFTFLLGGGPMEMICAFFGAGVGNFVRKLMLQKKISLLGNVAVSVAASCVTYVLTILLAQTIFGVSEVHQAGYICAMLFVIPGFPLITGGIDLAKLDIRSGLERITYALLIILTATMTGWVTALVCRFQPADFVALQIDTGMMIILRLITSFFGVYGFSLMFNSPRKMAMTAGLIGMFANTLRLELIDLAHFPVGIAAFIGAFFTGCVASIVKKKIGYPRISLTVPAIVIMVPGLYMYRGIYYIGLNEIGDGSLWLTKAILIVMALPMGLVAARLCTDKNFRHCT